MVFGILIALQINTWNQQSKDKKLEKYYLDQIVQELKTDKEQLIDFRTKIDNKLPLIKNLLFELHKVDNNDTFKEAFQAYINGVWQGIYFNSNSSTYEEMKSSGKLGLIKDNELRNAVISFYNTVDIFEESVAVNSEWLLSIDVEITHNQGMAKFLKAQAPMFTAYITDMDIYELKDKKVDLEKNAASHHWVIKDLSPYAEDHIKKIDKIIKKIENYK